MAGGFLEEEVMSQTAHGSDTATQYRVYTLARHTEQSHYTLVHATYCTIHEAHITHKMKPKHITNYILYTTHHRKIQERQKQVIVN